jgi:hypothetical protein
MCFVIFLFAFQFIAISFVSASITGWSQTTEVEYNITDAIDGSGYAISLFLKDANGTETSTVQTDTYDNTTGDLIIVSLSLPTTITDPDSVYLRYYLNTTFLADLDIIKVLVTYQYVGSGNLTEVDFRRSLPAPGKTFKTWPCTSNNATLTWTLEAFEVPQVKVMTKAYGFITWADASNLPVDTDYVAIRFKFYTGTMLLTQEQILQGLAGGIGLTWFILGAAVSPFWNPGGRSRSRRS